MLQNENFKYQERYLANRMTEAGQQPNRQTKDYRYRNWQTFKKT